VHIKEYLASRNLSRREFSLLINVSESAIAQYAQSRRTPTLLIALLIEEVTKRKVSLEDLLSDAELAFFTAFKNKRNK
jgi:transcriptional regulator with XRE-family HTH domain